MQELFIFLKTKLLKNHYALSATATVHNILVESEFQKKKNRLNK